MACIPLEDHLPGITGLFEYRRDAAGPIPELTQELMPGPSALTVEEREGIAAVISHENQCTFRTLARMAVADTLFCLYNRYGDGLGTSAPSDSGFHFNCGNKRAENGYARYNPRN